MKSILVLLFGVVLLIITNSGSYDESHSQFKFKPLKITKEETFGYQDIVADSLWLRTVQDLDYCENEKAQKSVNLGSTYQEALANKNTESRCKMGWVYQMLSVITDLAPRFKKPYTAGAVSLSVGVDDREGARLIFEKAVKQFPEDWTIAYAAAYHYLFEIQNATRAADLLLQANRYGGPSWLPVLASRLYTASGRQALGRSVLEEYLKTHPEGEGAERARQRLDELNKEK